MINGNIRFDGSNLFGSNPKYRYLPLWSVSGKWIISNEHFLSGSELVNNLAVRASYGLRGNIVEESTPQIVASALPPNEVNQLLQMEIIQAPNPELKWETTSSVNIGFELGMFDNRLTLDVDYYRDYSKDLIASKNVSSVTGFLNKFVNYADVKNQGVDVSVSGYIIRKKQFSWLSSVNLGYVKNKVVKSNITPQAESLVKSIYTPGEVFLGKPVNGMFSYRFARLDENGIPLFYDENNNILSEDDPEIEEAVYNNIYNLKYEGTRDPILSGGFNNVIRYKDFSLSFLFSFGLKNKVRLPEFAYNSLPEADQNANRKIMDRWRKPGDENNPETTPAFKQSANANIQNLWKAADKHIQKADYIKLNEIILAYQLPAKWIKNTFIKEMNMTFQVQNVWKWVANDQGLDPEAWTGITLSPSRGEKEPVNYTFGLALHF